MKSNFNFFLKVLFFLFIMFKSVFAQSFQFEAEIVETNDDNYIVASNNIIIKDAKGAKIFGDKLILDKKSKIYTITGNVIYEDKINLISINADKIIYNEVDKIINTEGPATLEKNNLYLIKSSDIEYDLLKKKISSNKKTTIEDNLKNKILIKNLDISLNDNLLIANDAELLDKDLNIYEIKNIYYDFQKKKLIGKDVTVNRDNSSSKIVFLPRIKSRSLVLENGNLTFNKSVYTSCKKRDGCPPWLIQAEKVEHNKKEKLVKYKNAFLKLYDVPVLYFPKFFHPDPSVERQSGFLAPTISTNNSSSFLKLPYFFEISDNSDFTLSPRFYDNNRTIFQGEYRLLTNNSDHIIDASINNKDSFISKKKNSMSHFFTKSSYDPKINFFEYSNVNLEIQSTSNDNYLKSYDLNSPIIDSQNTLNSKIYFEGYNDDLDFNISSEVFEDLSQTKDSDKYELILPNFELTKNLETKFDGTLEMNNLGYNKLFDTNINEKVFVNNLTYTSLDEIGNKGIIKNFEISLKNFNADSKNSKYLKNKQENDLQGIFQFNSRLPLIKNGYNFNSSLTPIFVAKFNPFKNKNIQTSDRLVNYDNIYSLNRIGSNETLEGNNSITIGNEYKIFNKSDNSNEIFGINLAASFRDKENADLPTKSSLGQKTSNVVGEMVYNPSEFLKFNYDFLIDNDLDEFNYHKIDSTITVNNFVTSFEFVEENNMIGDKSFIANESSLKIDKNKSLNFRTRKNKKTDLTEYYNLIYQYKMDCLTAGIEYKKQYYSDGTLKPEESIFFSITLMPFGNDISLPGLSK
tara:strand:+ start:13124 stop:15526 length:2403 start_codon:yes stop_codon:yes gene_type:complete